ncbi:MAG: MgtC/SapB family protein [Myxococcaceae bacterium]|nr:MgtC/SapB family protein [Myxococcaceae bacterium]
MEAFEPYLSYALALFSGLLIGLEREHSRVQEGVAGKQPARFIGGVRTFPIFALAAAVAASLSKSLGPWPFIIAATGTLVFAVLGHRKWVEESSGGLTSEGAFLLTFLLGALAGTTDVCATTRHKVFIVASLSVIATLLLSAKPVLHELSKKISRDDVIATIKFLLVAVVVLPLLPNEEHGPYGVLNPWKIGLNVTLIAGVSFVGYAATRVMGPGRGLLITGIVGGLASSTAVTLSGSQLTKDNPNLATAAALSITAASTVKTVRVLLLVAATSPALLKTMVGPFLAMAVAGALGAGFLYWRTRTDQKRDGQEPKLSNPFELSESLKFGAAVVVVMLISRWAQDQFGSVALYLTSLLAGLADVDAITLSVAGMAQKNEIAATIAVTAIFVAVLANTLTKQGMTMVIGTRALAVRVGVTSALMLAAGGVAIAMQALTRS